MIQVLRNAISIAAGKNKRSSVWVVMGGCVCLCVIYLFMYLFIQMANIYWVPTMFQALF